MGYRISYTSGSQSRHTDAQSIAEAVRVAVGLARQQCSDIQVTDPSGLTRTFPELERAVFAGEFAQAR